VWDIGYDRHSRRPFESCVIGISFFFSLALQLIWAKWHSDLILSLYFRLEFQKLNLKPAQSLSLMHDFESCIPEARVFRFGYQGEN